MIALLFHHLPMRRALSLAAIVGLIGIAVVGTLAVAILGNDVRANTAAAVALLAGSVLAVVGAIALYRMQPKVQTAAPVKSWAERRREASRHVLPIAASIAVIWGGGYVAVWLFPTKEWAYQWRYAFDDHLQDAEVEILPKPHDCEFFTAPIGSKHCHYERSVTTVRVARGQSGLVVSYDDGEKWESAESSAKASILVTWQRTED